MDAELGAMKTLLDALEPLQPEQRGRVVAWVMDRMEIGGRKPIVLSSVEADQAEASIERQDKSSGNAGSFATFAELFNAARPKSNADKALVGGYWLQVCQGAEDFAGFDVNSELKNLGESVANITDAFSSLKDAKPALALQIRKSGKSRQARKKYKLTHAGIQAVERMQSGDHT